MLTDKVTTLVLGFLLFLSVSSLAIVGLKNLQMSVDLSQSNVTIAEQQLALHQSNANIQTLEDSMSIQNKMIEELRAASIDAALKYEQALEASAPFIEEEERQILRIRNAPVVQDYEHIRQKMLRDAML